MNATKVSSVGDLLERAYAMELEAAERYGEFAAQMELHNNLETAALFRQFAELERKHAAAITAELTERGIATTGVSPLAMPDEEGLETALGDELHYLMTPYHALEIALRNEERSFAFFDELAEGPVSEDVRKLARRFAEEEEKHIRLVRDWLARVPEPGEDWSYDPDAPGMPE